MFDVGFWELALISAVALLIIGPERLPEAARTVGLWVGKGRRMLREAKADIDRELRNHEVTNLAELQKDIEGAGAQLKGAAEQAHQSVGAKDMADSLKQTFEEASPLGKQGESEIKSPESKTPETKSKDEAIATKPNGAKSGTAKKLSKKTGKKTTAKKTVTKKVTKKKVAKNAAPLPPKNKQKSDG